MKSLALSIAIFSLVVCGPAAQARTYYGAIAISTETMAFGWSGGATRAAAERGAYRHCRKHASDCRIELWMRNFCMSMARGRDAWGVAYNTNLRRAQREALNYCAAEGSGCKTVVNYCAR